MKKQENDQPKEAAIIYHENGPKSGQKGPKMDSWGQAGPFFPENATKKKTFVPVFDN